MILKIFKAMWFLSMVAVLANLLYVYASLPEEVIVQEENAVPTLASREVLFYIFTVFLIIVNVLVYVFSKVFSAQEEFRAWFHGLIICMNIFLIIALNLVQVYNSAEKFDFSRIAFIIYGSMSLMILWALSWPVYSVYKKIFPKEAVS